MLEKQICQEDSELEDKLIKQNVKDEYKLIKSILSNPESAQSLTPQKASKLYKALMDKKDKPIMSEEFLSKIQKFTESLKKSVQNDFEIDPVENQPEIDSSQEQNHPRGIPPRFEEERQRCESQMRERQSSVSEFFIENSSNFSSKRNQEVVQRRESEVQTQANTLPKPINFLEQLQMPAPRMNLHEEKKEEESQSIRNNSSLRVSELVLVSQATSVISSEFQALKVKHENLVNGIKSIKIRQNYRGEELEKYSPSSSYFHVGPKRECIQIYRALERLNLADFE